MSENNYGGFADGKGRSYYLHYLTTESTPFHDAIPDILKSYDPVTGLWLESPGYSFGTISMLLELSTLLKRCGIDIIADNLIMQKAALAVFPWMDERANMIVFGDFRGGTANFGTFEHLLAYYVQMEDTKNISRVATALKTGLENGIYKREDAGWTALCAYMSNIPATDGEAEMERMSYSPHHRLVTMKSEKGEENLMAVLYGGRNGYHLSPNGLALQLYGFGYALAPDAAGYESYWSKDHRYHQSATGSNTILPGYTEGNITIKAMEPSVEVGSFVNKQTLNPHINVCDIEAGEKRRVVAMVKTTSDKGYYVDIFRSNQMDNDYLFHNVGTALHLMDAGGNLLPLAETEQFGKIYSEGYHWFKKLNKTTCQDDFKAVWDITSGEKPLSMQMWMTGAQGRELYVAEAPYTTLKKGLTPNNVSMAPSMTPTLIVRQNGNNAWDSPFIAVFEPVRGNASVIGVKKMKTDGNAVVLCVESEGKRKDYIFSSTSPDVVCPSCKRQSFQGTFGIVSEQIDNLEQIYMVDGWKIEWGKYAIEASQPISASVYRNGNEWFYSSNRKATIRLGRKTYKVEAGIHQPLK